MRAFSQLLDDLTYTRSRNTKLRLIGDYLKETPDPDRGIALAALTGGLDIPAGEPAEVDDGTLRLSAVVERLRSISKSDAPAVLSDMLDHLDAEGRYALLK